MFWSCFHRHTQGPSIFWEKDWGSINQESYCVHTIPVIYRYIELQRRQGVQLYLMQDGVPGHTAGETQKNLEEQGIKVIYWPPFPPDLNPIERV
jgi:transposase